MITSGQSNLTQGRIAAEQKIVDFSKWCKCASHLKHGSLSLHESASKWGISIIFKLVEFYFYNLSTS